ncbi:MAG TPA: translation initiation factor IF-2 [Ignavibacteria bacterium]|nr:translation initiation factor IF-2 [Bacteroidota bacterium]HRE09230.1 translation initiation factor IF-2 [Ignavibacteria bacterium]HRF66192.1 translation initiation factor IF-2 [Ignavibacteria bacterium]HRJ05678.1 translation initiation factor IF-2 [Ignavibacteria bacterium]HRJ86367.1 translation initiation factor IF-2 [Ignavibacteria bacterium]
MPETNKGSKGIQISKIAKEVNRQSSEILEYLKRIGIEVGGVMSKVDESAYHKVLGHFKSDLEEAEKHKQKLVEFKKKHKGIEIAEIEDEVRKETEKKLKEEEEKQKKRDEEDKVKHERESQLQKDLEEKRRLIKEKEVELEQQKIREEEAKKQAALDALKPKPVEPAKPEIKPTDTKAAEVKQENIPAAKKPDEKSAFKPAEKKPYTQKPGEFKPKRHDDRYGRRDGGGYKGKSSGTSGSGTSGSGTGSGTTGNKKPGGYQGRKTGGTFERVTIKDDFRKNKKPAPGGQKPGFKKPFTSREDEKKKDDKGQTKPATENADAQAKKRDFDKNLKSKKQKYQDGAEAKKKKKLADEEVTAEIEEAIRETMAKMDESGSSTARQQLRKRKKKERLEQELKEAEEILARANIIQVTEFASTSELATLMEIEVSQLIQKCFELGMMVTINQRLDKDLITLLADEFGFKIEFQKEYEVDSLADIEDDETKLVHRPPVVTIMGHVDHGKTSLLDYIRKASVVAGEAGGITQHIGAYQVKLEDGRLISFLDTPGHEAFTAMRARGAQITDIVVLVVAADDSVMPQTIEAINHALAANVPIVVAINKIDKPGADPTKIKTQLSEKGVLVEEYGGKYQSIEISAKQGTNVDQLLEKILVEAEVLDLKANPDRSARGAIVEAKLDKGKGITATVLVQKGTLHTGDSFVAGNFNGRVKAMYDERGHRVTTALPSTPVQVLGFDGMPQAGDVLVSMDSEREAREIALKRQQLKREQDFRQVRFITLDDISKQIKEGKQVDLNVIIKGDVDGSVEALSDSLLKLGTSEVKVSIIHKAIGEITEYDVLLAAASSAIIVGFGVRPNLKARKLAETEKVDIRLHNIIYDVINEIKLALEGLLEPEKTEEVLATVEVRETFKVPKIGTVAGCYVVDGKVVRNNKVRLLRDGFVIFDGHINALKRFKDDVREVEQGFECGMSLENYNDIKVGDIIESYTIVETKRKLEQK